MATEAPQQSESPDQPRRDGVGMVLSGVTIAVLLVGVLVIRSTRSDHPTPPPAPEQQPEEEVATAPQAEQQPEVMIAWPKNRGGEVLR